MDINCPKCGEPWDSYGIHNHVDMTRSQAKKFLEGRGCPSCKFGTICVQCGGTGTAESLCKTCFGSGRILVRKYMGELATGIFNDWVFGYEPDVRPGPKPYEKIESHPYKNGMVEEGWAWCPDCNNSGPVCQWCNGTGKFQPPEDPMRASENSLWDILESTDEDGINIIDNWMFPEL